MSNGNAVLLGEGKNRVREDEQEGKGGRRSGGRERETLTVLIPSQSLVVWEEMLEAILSTKLLW